MAATARILLVAHNPYNVELLSTLLHERGYDTLCVTTLQEFDQALASNNAINIALVDVDGFERSIWERCELLQSRRIPLLVIAHGCEIERIKFLQHGAYSVLRKPLISSELVSAISILLGGSA